MLRLYRRHGKRCPQRSERYRRCACPIYVEGTLAKERIRRALDLTSWEAATDLIATWQRAGRIGTPATEATPTIAGAVDRFLEDAEARNLKSSSIRKYRFALKNRLTEPAERAGRVELKQLTVEFMRTLRRAWNVAPRTQQKTLETLRGFFRFCEASDWITKNPMRGLRAPKVDAVPTLPVSDQDFEKLIGGTNAQKRNDVRLRTLLLVLRYSGLRISDVVLLTADRLRGDRLFLRQQKTGTDVHLPLPESVAADLRAEFAERRRPFWSGHGSLDVGIDVWRRKAYKLAARVGVEQFHFHRLRDSFAVSLLERGVDIEMVAVLLGHSSSAVTRLHYNPWVHSRQASLEVAVRRTWRTVA